MRIAIQVSDLDQSRIDGTRVYIRELINRLGSLAPDAFFELYHQKDFHPDLQPKTFPNYQEKKIPFPWAWMQTRFAWEVLQSAPDKLFLPIQAAPFFLAKKQQVIATVHDLAWKKFPETFSWGDRLRLDLHLAHVVRRADKLIAVSESTKKDLLEYFPSLSPEKIQVIHHGFDGAFYQEQVPEEEQAAILSQYNVKKEGYVLYVGALQPRKNLVRLIEAFEKLKEESPEAKLVLAGEVAWLAGDILEAQNKSIFKDDIILLGRVSFETLRVLYQSARLVAFPSLYEGFGLPVLEAFASKTPLLTADNSSLREVAGEGALYCNGEDVLDIAMKLQELWQNQTLREALRVRGQEELKRFSWEKCAKETLDFILK
ncbi:MAG: glycosyltransferase family 4 protein [Candidatus Moranbacteria bacterium]|nr:glycosyltransferase family 4 protein [Candidatus Moranbacteria bacterium]